MKFEHLQDMLQTETSTIDFLVRNIVIYEEKQHRFDKTLKSVAQPSLDRQYDLDKMTLARPPVLKLFYESCENHLTVWETACK